MMTGEDDSGTDGGDPGAWGAGSSPLPASWDFEADVVVIGAGATGLPAALKAVEAGASVMVVEANYDIGGHAILSGGNVPLGGGTSAQRKYGMADSPDLVFADLTDWSIVQPNGWPDYRYNDRAIMRAFADHCAATYEFLVAKGVTFKDVPPDNVGAHSTGNSAPRENHAFWTDGTGLGSPSGRNGAGLVRPLEESARAKGVRFLLHYKMTRLLRTAANAAGPGRVVGVTAQYTPRILPGALTPLPSYRSAGNIDCCKIQRPPFYAAWATPLVHDTRAGLRINARCQVMDMQGQAIPGLYCGGESAGGFNQHGLGRCVVQGYIAGKNAAMEQPQT